MASKKPKVNGKPITEIWKDIPYLEGKFIASSEGRIAKIVGAKSAGDYQMVGIPEKLLTKRLRLGSAYTGKSGYRVYVHHLIALTFLGEPPNDEQTQINHKDAKRGNNRPENLEWSTQKENVNHALNVMQLRRLPKYTEKQYVEARKLYATGEYSYNEVAKLVGMSWGSTQHAIKYSRRAR